MKKKPLTIIAICLSIVTLAAVLLMPDTNHARFEHTHHNASAEMMMGMR